VNVDREQLSVALRLSAGADADEAYDLPVAFRDECRRPAPRPVDCLIDGKRRELLLRQRVRVSGLPGLDVNPGNPFRILRCSGANHLREPTLSA